MLRDQSLKNNAICITWQIKRLRSMLGSKKELAKSPFASSLKLVREQLRMKLKMMRYIGLRKLLNHQLYNLMLSSETQLEVLPSIQIMLDEKTKVTMELNVRLSEGPRFYNLPRIFKEKDEIR